MKKVFLLIACALFSIVSFAQETVTVSPTWGEAFHYAHKTGQIPWTILGVLCGVALIVILVLGFDKVPDWVAGKFIMICIILAVTCLGSIFAKPGNIKWNNDKTVDALYLNHVGHKHIIDSCYENNLMIGAAIKK